MCLIFVAGYVLGESSCLSNGTGKIQNSSGTKKKVERPKQVENKDAPTILQAEQIMGRPARDLYLDYEVEVQRDQTLLTGDHGIFRQEENEAELVGNVFIQRFGDQFTGLKRCQSES